MSVVQIVQYILTNLANSFLRNRWQLLLKAISKSISQPRNAKTILIWWLPQRQLQTHSKKMPIALYAAFDLSQSGLSHGGRLKVILARDDSDLQNIDTHTVYTVSKCIKYIQRPSCMDAKFLTRKKVPGFLSGRTSSQSGMPIQLTVEI